ncbi:MAG TPA: hypothetical protein VG754_09810 [Verrucomicrobiae bacterium]|jgi:hypothetical protein|nr:hypothetical protein [Verrucomicrobiae bacterium]
MPIRINLLAEAQAAEELRRRDPVKRALWAGVCLILMVVVWISSLQVKIMADTSRLGNLQARLDSRTNQYTQILQNKQTLLDINEKLAALNRLAAERLLQATLLDAPLHTPVDGIQILRLHTEQGFDVTPAVPAVVERGKTVVPAKSAGSIERVKLILDGKDTSPNPGNEQITKFKETLAGTPYFHAQQISTNNILLKNLSAPQLDSETGKPYVLFSLECQYPERAHSL